MSGLYIHIPFCRQKCQYCDFASFSGKEKWIEDYLTALEQEASFYSGQTFDTLYIGGGTPSLLSEKQLLFLCEIITRHFGHISSFSESTLEANPESLSFSKIHLLKQAGFTRLSLGLQSFDDAVLARIGRIHTANTFLTAYENARKAGFENINVDLIAGLPTQSEEGFLQGVRRLVSLRPEHISIYGLQVEEGTPFYLQGVASDEDLLRRELENIHFYLRDNGYEHYEISNYARKGYRSKHNINYWKNAAYLGLGSAAASYQNGERRNNTDDLQEYIRRIFLKVSPVEFSEKLTGKAKEGETIMLGLRMLDGLHLTSEQQQIFCSEISALIQGGLVSLEKDLLKLTFKGMFLANQAFMAFVGPFDL